MSRNTLTTTLSKHWRKSRKKKETNQPVSTANARANRPLTSLMLQAIERSTQNNLKAPAPQKTVLNPAATAQAAQVLLLVCSTTQYLCSFASSHALPLTHLTGCLTTLHLPHLKILPRIQRAIRSMLRNKTPNLNFSISHPFHSCYTKYNVENENAFINNFYFYSLFFTRQPFLHDSLHS